jgi:hypothetical protein
MLYTHPISQLQQLKKSGIPFRFEGQTSAVPPQRIQNKFIQIQTASSKYEEPEEKGLFRGKLKEFPWNFHLFGAQFLA